jgi:hypothetical protein
MEGGHPVLVDRGCARAQLSPKSDARELLRSHPPNGPETRAFAAGCGGGPALLRRAEDLALLCAFDLVHRARDRAPERLAEKLAAFHRLARLAPGRRAV